MTPYEKQQLKRKDKIRAELSPENLAAFEDILEQLEFYKDEYKELKDYREDRKWANRDFSYFGYGDGPT